MIRMKSQMFDKQYLIVGKLRVSDLDKEGSFGLAQSDNVEELISLGEQLENLGVITNLIIIQNESKTIVWKSKLCIIPPDEGKHNELLRWLWGGRAFKFPAV